MNLTEFVLQQKEEGAFHKMASLCLSLPGLDHKLSHQGPVAAAVLYGLKDALGGILRGDQLWWHEDHAQVLLHKALFCCTQAPVACAITTGAVWQAPHGVHGASISTARKLSSGLRVGEIGLCKVTLSEITTPKGVGQLTAPGPLQQLGAAVILKDYRE